MQPPPDLLTCPNSAPLGLPQNPGLPDFSTDPRTFKGGWGRGLLGALGIMVSLSPVLAPILPPHREHPRASYASVPPPPIPYPSSPWRTPRPSFRSSSETRTPMASGPWPSHHSQVRPPNLQMHPDRSPPRRSWSLSPCPFRPEQTFIPGPLNSLPFRSSLSHLPSCLPYTES